MIPPSHSSHHRPYSSTGTVTLHTQHQLPISILSPSYLTLRHMPYLEPDPRILSPFADAPSNTQATLLWSIQSRAAYEPQHQTQHQRFEALTSIQSTTRFDAYSRRLPHLHDPGTSFSSPALLLPFLPPHPPTSLTTRSTPRYHVRGHPVLFFCGIMSEFFSAALGTDLGHADTVPQLWIGPIDRLNVPFLHRLSQTAEQ